MNWAIKRIKDIKSSKANAFADGPFGSNLKTEHFVENGDVLVIDSGYITSGNFAIHREFKTISFEHFLTVKRSECKDGDLIIAKIGANFGMSAILPKLDKPSLVSGNTLKLTINDRLYFNKFIHYQFLNKKTLGEIDVLVKGSAQPALSMGLLNDIEFILPNSLCKQQAIANYLDAKTQAIDKKVSLLEQKIETYKKLKRTLINQTITKGLRSLSEVEMKDSGISWIGQIPQHWEVKRLKDVLLKNDGGVWGEFVDDGTIVLRSTEVDIDGKWKIDNPAISKLTSKEIKSSLLEKGDLLITKSSGSDLHIGKTAFVDDYVAGLQCCYSNFMQRLRINTNNYSKYYFWFLNSEISKLQYLYNTKSTTGLGNLSSEIFNLLLTVVPPKSEQEEIAKYLDHKTATIDAIVGNISKQIETLKQLRKTLINDVVTGKIKVLE